MFRSKHPSWPGKGLPLPTHLSPLLLQGDELQLLAGLASDAAGLLWELAAMHDTGDAATDMLTKSEQLQVCHSAMDPYQACLMS